MLQWISYNPQRLKKIAIIAGAIFVAVFLFGIIYRATPASAQTAADTSAIGAADLGIGYGDYTGLSGGDIRVTIANIIRVALSLLGIILIVLILYAGFLWMTAGGNEEQIGKAKKILRNAIVGLAIILSAYMIVQFIFKILGYDTILGGPGVKQPYYTNLSGSGALGKIIKDHYPMRDQVDVPRNTKIVITFFKPIKLDESWIEDTSGDGVLGNCKDPIADFTADCDQLKLSDANINIKKLTKNSQGTFDETSIDSPDGGAAIFAAPVNGQVDTIVIRPNENLGSPSEDVPYRVYVGQNIKWDDPENGDPGIFEGFAENQENQYYWKFTCNTQIDSSPPYVKDVFPGEGAVEFKNTEIQITFNEPVDPTGIQGMFTATSVPRGDGTFANYFILDGNNVFLQNGDGFPSGTMKLTGNYRVLSFTPSAVCGYNACGQPMYCLPTPAQTVSTYDMMLRSARTVAEEGSKNFESVPFTGVNDMAGNALDSSLSAGNKVGPPNGVVNTAPTVDPVFNIQLKPDNYWWQFKIKDEMDLTSPYLRQIYPGIDAGDVPADQRWAFVFSKRMRVAPLYGITIAEHPSPAERCVGHASEGCIPIPLWKLPLAPVFGEPIDGMSERFVTTTVDFLHGPFIKAILQYYLPELTSDIEDVGFNCFYPGLGPGGVSQTGFGTSLGKNPSDLCDQASAFNADGTPNASDSDNCCDVNLFPVHQAYCCNGQASGVAEPKDSLWVGTTTCQAYIKTQSPTK